MYLGSQAAGTAGELKCHPQNANRSFNEHHVMLRSAGKLPASAVAADARAATTTKTTEAQTLTHPHPSIQILGDYFAAPIALLRSNIMSGSAQGSNDMKKAVANDSKNGEQPLAPEKKPATQLEEDDEFEDFPVEGRAAR